MLGVVPAARAATKYAEMQECWRSQALLGTSEHPTCAGSAMNTASRASCTRATRVAPAETIFSGRVHPETSTVTSRRFQSTQPQETAASAPTEIIAPQERVNAAVAAK